MTIRLFMKNRVYLAPKPGPNDIALRFAAFKMLLFSHVCKDKLSND